jgi:Tfp pilus assembly protein PilO
MVENKITKNKYFYSVTVIILTVVVTLGLFFLLIMPFFNKAKELTAETSLKKQELEKLEEKKSKLEELKTREEELKLQAEKVENALPTEKDVGRLFIQLDNLARGNGGTVASVSEGGNVTTTKVTPDTGEGGPTIERVSYTFPVDFGTYFNLKDFVTKSETALRLLAIKGLTINASNEGKIGSNFSIDTYIRKE